MNIDAAIRHTLAGDPRVVFAYRYGSSLQGQGGRDIDIAVFAVEGADLFSLSADLKVALAAATGLAADRFDVRVINDLIENGDLFALLYLKAVLQTDAGLQVDRAPDRRTDFIERFSMKYRSCEGLFQEVLV